MASNNGSIVPLTWFQFHLGEAFLRAGVNHRKIQLLIGGVKRNEQVEHQVQDLVRRGVVAGQSC